MNKELHRALDEDDLIVGGYLQDNSESCITVDVVLKATSLEELQSRAELEAKRRELYYEWCNIFGNRPTSVKPPFGKVNL